MNTDETYELEDRVYVNPTQSRDEQLQFVENLRDVQAQNNQQIAADTYALGTQVPTNLGGLTSGAGNADSYWMSRYQTPQIQSAVANLQATAQADALSKIMAQDEAQYQNRANQAYRNYQKRQRARARSGGSGGTTPLGNTPDNQKDPDVTTTKTDDKTSLSVGNDKLSITTGPGGVAGTVTVSPSLDGDGYWIKNESTGESVWHGGNNGSSKSNSVANTLGKGFLLANPLVTAALYGVGKLTGKIK